MTNNKTVHGLAEKSLFLLCQWLTCLKRITQAHRYVLWKMILAILIIIGESSIFDVKWEVHSH